MKSLFAFHRGIGSNDEDATVQERCEKILYYQSASGIPDPEKQMNEVGNCEAFIDLCQSFGCESKCESFVLTDTVYSLFECEKDTWMILSVRSSVSPQTNFRAKSGPFKLPLMRYGKIIEQNSLLNLSKLSHKSKPDDKIMHSILKEIYSIFVLLHGRLDSILNVKHIPYKIRDLRRVLRKTRKFQEEYDTGNLEPNEVELLYLRERIENEDRLASYLAKSPADTVRKLLSEVIPSCIKSINFSNLQLFYTFKNMIYFPVDEATYLSTQYFIRLLKLRFHQIEDTILMYNGQLLWSSLMQGDTKNIYNLILQLLDAESESFNKSGFLSFGKDSPQRNDAKAIDCVDIYAPSCHLHEKNGSSLSIHRFAAYQLSRATLVVVLSQVDDGASVDDSTWTKKTLLSFCGELESYISLELLYLTRAISKGSRTSYERSIIGHVDSQRHRTLNGSKVNENVASMTLDRSGDSAHGSLSLYSYQEARQNVQATLFKSRFFYMDGGNLLSVLSYPLVFPALLFVKQQNEQLIDQLKLLNVYESHNIVLGPRELGQGLSILANSALNSISECFSDVDSHISEHILSIPPSKIPFLKERPLHGRASSSLKSAHAKSFVDTGWWLAAINTGRRSLVVLFEPQKTLPQVHQEFEAYKGCFFRV